MVPFLNFYPGVLGKGSPPMTVYLSINTDKYINKNKLKLSLIHGIYMPIILWQNIAYIVNRMGAYIYHVLQHTGQ